MVISSRKVERLEAAAEELKQKIPASSLASVVPIACNIRHEDEVHTLLAFTSMVSIGIHLCFNCCIVVCLCVGVGEGPGFICTQEIWSNRLFGE